MAKNHFPRAKNGLNEVFKEGIYVEKWSQNFDSGTGSAIFGNPKIAKNTHFRRFGGHRKWHFGCPNQNSKTTFQYKYPP